MKRLSVVNKVSRINEGNRYGSWVVTQYIPLTFDDLSSPFGGKVKLVNQDTYDSIIIQHDHQLRGAKWWTSYNGKRLEETSPEKVIKKLTKD